MEASSPPIRTALPTPASLPAASGLPGLAPSAATAPATAKATACGACETSANTRSWSATLIRVTCAPSCCHSACRRSTESGRFPGSGLSTTSRLTNRSRSAASGPPRSLPAMGWQGTKSPSPGVACPAAPSLIAAIVLRQAVTTGPFTLDRSVSTASGGRCAATSGTSAQLTEMGAASTTRSASASASATESTRASKSPSSMAREMSGSRPKPTRRTPGSRARSAAASEPPIRPVPRMATCLNITGPGSW